MVPTKRSEKNESEKKNDFAKYKVRKVWVTREMTEKKKERKGESGGNSIQERSNTSAGD